MSSATLATRAPQRGIVITPRVRGCSVRRYYDPATGQFISVDPAVDQTEAPYAYVGDDPVDGVDPLGLGCFLGIACGVQSAVANTLNPWSSSNPIREWAASGSWTSDVLYLNPAYGAVVGYAAEAQAYENGCSFWNVAGYGTEAVFGLGLAAFGDEAAAEEGFISGAELLAREADSPVSGELSAAGRALAKHGGRPGSAFPAALGSASAISTQAGEIVREILSNATRRVSFYSPRLKTQVIDIYDATGRGLRYDAQGGFIGFLEPPR